MPQSRVELVDATPGVASTNKKGGDRLPIPPRCPLRHEQWARVFGRAGTLDVMGFIPKRVSCSRGLVARVYVLLSLARARLLIIRFQHKREGMLVVTKGPTSNSPPALTVV